MEETIPEYLARVRRNDIEKHGPEAAGLRSTREIATFFGIATRQARRRLKVLLRERVVEEFEAIDREGSLWALTDIGLLDAGPICLTADGYRSL